MKNVISPVLKNAIKKLGVNLKEEEITRAIEVPKSSEMGDYAFPCFILSKQLKDNPANIAMQVRENISKLPSEFKEVQTSGPYVNFFLDREKIAKILINKIAEEKDSFGSSSEKNPQKIMIEFSQSNTHKAFHVGHIRGTSIGESLARICEFCGEKVIRANYQGDTGMHVSKWLWCYKKFHSKEKLKNDESWIASIYVDAVKRLAKNPAFQEEINEINRKLSSGEDPELNALWKTTRDLSLESFEKIYAELNTHFDEYFFESRMEEKGKAIVDELLKKKIAEVSDEAVIIDLKKYNLGVWVLLRKDGTILYSAKDLALADEKFKTRKIDSSITLHGAEQILHMAQLSKTLELMKFSRAADYKFLPFFEVRLPTGKMSSRTGENILYSDFIEEVTKYASKLIKKKFPKISKKELEERALKISIASIKYSMLKQTPSKVIIFKKEDALNFEGDTGPYIQYSYARASSILKKIKSKKDSPEEIILENQEVELVKKLLEFPEIILNARANLNPAIIANYSYQLAQIFNEFYHACPVINSENESFRISLLESFRQVLKNSLTLLGIEALEEM